VLLSGLSGVSDGRIAVARLRLIPPNLLALRLRSVRRIASQWAILSSGWARNRRLRVTTDNENRDREND